MFVAAFGHDRQQDSVRRDQLAGFHQPWRHGERRVEVIEVPGREAGTIYRYFLGLNERMVRVRIEPPDELKVLEVIHTPDRNGSRSGNDHERQPRIAQIGSVIDTREDLTNLIRRDQKAFLDRLAAT